jgi:hypothetical protein
MWCCSIRPGCAVVACALLALAAPVTRAQDRDETWVIAQIATGKFEELRSLEKMSEEGTPFAKYWWGVILERCIFERCDKHAARELILRAAVAGHSRARVHLLFPRPQVGLWHIASVLRGAMDRSGPRADIARATRNDESARGISPRAAHRTVRKPLDLYGSCHRAKAAAFH